MHIILALIGALAGLLWALSRFMNTARQSKEIVDEVRGVIRTNKWSRRIDKRLIENLSDPREAAAILLLQTASYEGAITHEQQDHIVQLMKDSFQTDIETAESLFSFARLALGEINDASNSLRKILVPIADVCTPDEKNKLVKMMHEVSTLTNTPNDQQSHIITHVNNSLFQ